MTKFNGASSTEFLTARLKKEAMQLPIGTPLAWITQFYLSFPATPKMYHDMQGYGIICIAVMNPDSSQFPVTRVYLKTKTGADDLREMGHLKVTVTDPITKSAFGKNRVDYYFLIPYRATQDSCELRMHWNNSEQEVLLARFPDNLKINFIKNGGPAETGDINPLVLKQFMRQEFHIAF